MTEALRLVDHPLAVRVSLALLHFAWQGAALAVIAAFLLPALRRTTPAARYLALLGVLAAMAACPVVTFALTARAPLPPPTAVAVTAPLRTQASPPLSAAAPTPLASSSFPRQSRPLVGANHPQAPWAVGLREWVRAKLPWVSVLWLVGVVALSLRLLARWWGLRGVGQGLQAAEPQWQELLVSLWGHLGMSRPVRLMVSAAARVPMVLGWLRPVVVLPASALTGLTAEQLTPLLGHELAHLRRHDHWVNSAQTLIELLLFYHPAVWWVSGAIRAEREHCCDDAAVGLCETPAAYLRALAWVEEHRDRQLRPAIGASGSPLLGRIRRLAGYPAPAEIRPAWLAAALALAMALAVPLAGSISRAAPDGEGHTAGQRDQWQPERERDPRLQQPVQIEILGRAAIPALALLSEKTGVSLQVAPEDLETVGERKLTIIAQGCSLKAIMVWVPTALQECHWDIVTTGPEPVYVLHRNGGAEEAMARLAEEVPLQERLRREEEGRPARAARVEAARKALAMSPEELAELEKTDLYLARSVKDPKSRSMLELFLSLPEDQMKQFIDTGVAAMAYPSAPEHFRKAADKLLQESREEWTAKEGAGGLGVRIVDVVQSDIAHATIQYEDEGNGGSYMRIFAFDKEGERYSWGVEPALRSQYPSPSSPHWYRPLLLGSGTSDEKAADALAQEWERKGAEERERRKEGKRKAEWQEPRSPQLHRTITLPFEDKVDPVEVQRFIAKESGLSLVSDYYTSSWLWPLPEEARAAMPIWWLLYVLGDRWLWTYDWDEAGDCLVFHDRYWYRKPPEVPESLVQACREKLRKQGGFTLDDAAAAAVALASRVSSRAGFGRAKVAVPNDLGRVGLSAWALTSPYLLLYASLSSEQRAKAWSAAGLLWSKMTRAQQELVRQTAAIPARGPITPERIRLSRVPEAEISKAVFRIRQSSRSITEPGPGDLLERGAYLVHELQVVLPSRQVGTQVWLRPPKPSA